MLFNVSTAQQIEQAFEQWIEHQIALHPRNVQPLPAKLLFCFITPSVGFWVSRVLPWCGTPMQAYVWYRSEPIPSFGDLTAEEPVKRGMAEAVLEYIGRIAKGGYT
jgi:hypothetical protein